MQNGAHLIDQVINPTNVLSIFANRNATSLCGLLKAKYDRTNLRKLLEDHFGRVSVQAVPRGIFIPAFAVNGGGGEGKSASAQMEHAKKDDDPEWMNRRCKDRWHGVYFHNLQDAKHKDDDENCSRRKDDGEHLLGM